MSKHTGSIPACLPIPQSGLLPLVVNNAGKIETTLSQMEQWLILSDIINHVQYNKHSKNFHSMSVRPLKKWKTRLKIERMRKKDPYWK